MDKVLFVSATPSDYEILSSNHEVTEQVIRPTGLSPGEPPPTLIDFFKKDFLLIIDESHMTIPQVGAMYRGDQSRKQTLIDFGFRLLVLPITDL